MPIWIKEIDGVKCTMVRDPKDIYNLDSKTLAEQGRANDAAKFVHDWKVKPPQSCSGCHR